MRTIIIKNLGDCKYHTSTAIDSQIATDRIVDCVRFLMLCKNAEENLVIFYILRVYNSMLCKIRELIKYKISYIILDPFLPS